LTNVVAELPHDWQARYRLARALNALGRRDEARAQAEAVARLRERLDPVRIGPLLDDALARADTDPAARSELAGLLDQIELSALAEAWRAAGQAAATHPAPLGPAPSLLPRNLPARPRLPVERGPAAR
jgi:thioredoxin-like negative regulator of GroEL